MTKQPTRQEILSELTRLRADCEHVKRQQQRLQARTSRLYLHLQIESLQPESPRTLKT